jgi:hypothetical protein
LGGKCLFHIELYAIPSAWIRRRGGSETGNSALRVFFSCHIPAGGWIKARRIFATYQFCLVFPPKHVSKSPQTQKVRV